MKDTNTTLAAITGAVVIGVAGFMIGQHTRVGFTSKWANDKVVGYGRVGNGFRGHMMADADEAFGRGRGGRGMGYGEVTAINGNTVTIKYADDTTADITLNDKTSVNKFNAGSASDIAVGQTIMVMGGGFWNDTQTVIIK